MDVSNAYLRRLLQSNASHFSNSTRASDAANNASTYPLLASEVQKLSQIPQQASRFAEAFDTNETDLFRDLNLAGFADHFKLDPMARLGLALACKSVAKQDLVTKGESVVSCASGCR